MKHWVLIVGLTCVVVNSSYSQLIPSTNIYSRLELFSDTLSFKESKNLGISSLISSDYSESFIDCDDDSNTYVNFNWILGSLQNLGTGANQKIRADLIKPFKNSTLISSFIRRGMEGWVDNSSIRTTELFVDYKLRIGTSTVLQTDFRFDDKRLNYFDGLSDTSYKFSNGNIRDWTIDMNSSQESAEGRAFNGGLELDRALITDSIKNVNLYVQLDANTGNRKYFNALENRLLIDQYLTSSNNGFTDSVRLLTGAVSGGLSYDRVLFGLEDGIQFELSGRYTYGQLVWNDQAMLFDDFTINATARVDTKKWSFLSKVNVALFGLNAGAYALNASLSRNDSIRGSVFRTSIRANVSETPMPLFYYRYSSQLKSIRNEFILPAMQFAGLKMLWNKNESLELGVLADVLRINSNLTLNQAAQLLVNNVSAIRLQGFGRIENNSFGAQIRATRHFGTNEFEFSFPELILNGRLYFNLPIFKRAADIKLGTDALYYTEYFARGFHPFIHEWYVQDEFTALPFLRLDAFAEATINSVRVEGRIANLLYGLIEEELLIAPNYPMVPRFFQLRVNWLFKN